MLYVLKMQNVYKMATEHLLTLQVEVPLKAEISSTQVKHNALYLESSLGSE